MMSDDSDIPLMVVDDSFDITHPTMVYLVNEALLMRYGVMLVMHPSTSRLTLVRTVDGAPLPPLRNQMSLADFDLMLYRVLGESLGEMFADDSTLRLGGVKRSDA